ncbi:MAG TPA: response regulator [Planctomycetota bacterium]|nr:response regulator [Planctomycetota bacterium]
MSKLRKILIVDDKPEVRTLIEMTLDIGAFCFLQAADGNKAIELAQKELPDLMILDVMMPGGMDGYQVCELLKKDPKTKNIAIILLTARGQEHDKVRGTQAGADDYFIKPFSPRDLLHKVYDILDME